MAETTTGLKRTVRVAAFGDSLSYRNPQLQWKHWTDLVAERLQVQFIYAGIGGNRSDQGLARMERDVLEHGPDYIVANFGMNDHVMKEGGKPNTPLADYETNLREIAARAAAAGAVLVWATPNAIFTGDAARTDENYYYNRHAPEDYAEVGGAQAWLDQYNDVMRRLAAEAGAPLADVRLACEGQDMRLLTTDGVHCSEQGHLLYAEVIAAVLEKLLASHR